jgi:transposase
MPRIIRIHLEEAQRQELEQVRDHHPKAFLRERAAAVLKVAQGQVIQHVALHGLLKRHEPETVKVWIERYLSQGVAGWKIQAGRGRKPKFSPSGRGKGG